MLSDIFNTLFTKWSKHNFLEPILLVSMVYSIFNMAIMPKKSKLHTYFLIGLSLHSICFLLTQIYPFIHPNKSGIYKKQFILIINNFLIIIEYIIFSYFYLKTLNNIFFKKIITTIGWLLFPSVTIVQFLSIDKYNNTINTASFALNSIEFITILIVSLRYFFETTQSKSQVNLINDENFRISSAILIYISSSLPYITCGSYLFNTNFNVYTVLSTIHYLAICTLFILIANSFKTNTQNQI